jgi:purine-nucleoside phosphorylase
LVDKSELDLSVEHIQSVCGTDPVATAILLGHGLEGLMEGLQDAHSFHFRDLPGFPVKSEPSQNEGVLTIGVLEGARVALLHGYGSYSDTGVLNSMALPFETLTVLGCTTLAMATGVISVNADIIPGHIVSVIDHINLSGLNPLVGAASEGGFMSLAEAYDPRLQRRLRRATVSAGVSFQDAVMMWFPGLTFATAAEVKVARTLGADVIGHSFIPELIVARRIGLRIVMLGVVSGYGAGFVSGNPTHASFRAGSQQGVISLRRLWRAFLRVKEDAWSGQTSQP